MVNKMNTHDAQGNFVFLPLERSPYYLEPYISERTVRLHYYGHTKAYVAKLNSLYQRKYLPNVSMELLLHKEKMSSAIYLNASQVYNHYLYFEQLNAKGVKSPFGEIQHLISDNYGNWDSAKEIITTEGLSIFGSGWVFLTYSPNGALHIRSFIGTGTPLDETILIALDVWEHAYYLDYPNDRKGYIENFFSALDWNIVEKRLKCAL